MKIFIVLLYFAALCAGRKSYEGYSVFRIIPETEQGSDAIIELFENSWFSTELDFWHMSHTLDDPTDVMVPPKLHGLVEDYLKRRKMKFSVLIENVQEVIHPQMACSYDITDEAFYTCYHTLDEIDGWIYGMRDLYPERVSVEQVSTTYEGRDVMAIKISGQSGTERPAAVFQGGIHAREWISPATMMSIAKMLLDKYGVDSDITSIVDYYDIYIIPVLNKDGYLYSWEYDRLWRKNRQPYGGWCDGVDLNRNWDVGFGGEGARGFRCSYIYHGPKALSEPETSGIDQWSRALQDRSGVHVYIDFHSYGLYWLWPWGYMTGLPPTPDHDDQKAAAEVATNALTDVYGTTYKVHVSALMYGAAGATEDWAYYTLRAKYSYIVELRPESSDVGFLLPDSQIEPSSIETFAGLKALLLHTSADEDPIAKEVGELPKPVW